MRRLRFALLLSLVAAAAIEAGLEAPRSFGAGFHPVDVVTGDLNGDGKGDVVVASSGTVSVLLGRGDGTFQPTRTIDAGLLLFPHSMLGVDVNGDGRLDLVLGDTSQARVFVLLGHGDGTFAPASVYAAPEPHTGGGGTLPNLDLAAGDLNGDGKVDLAATSSNEVRIYFGNGDGSFVFAGRTVLTQTLAGAAIGDLDGDGKPDVVVGGGGVTVLRGHGDGTFEPGVPYPGSGGTNGVAVADLNGDGRPDVLAASVTANGVSVFLNAGGGTLTGPISYAAVFFPKRVLARDVDGDGRPDVVLTCSRGVAVYRGNGDGSLQEARVYVAGVELGATVVLDANRDGFSDLAVANTSSNDLSILLGAAGGRFLAPRRYPTSSSYALGSADLDHDGRQDVVVGSSDGSLDSFVARADGTFGKRGHYPGTGLVIGIAFADFNGDGYVDVVASNQILLGNGDGTFLTPPLQTLGFAGVAAGDFDGDGNADIALGRYGQQIDVQLGNGDGTFRAPQTYAAAYTQVMTARDLDGDGRADLVVGGSDSVAVYLSQPNGSLSAPASYPLAPASYPVEVADVNGDGKADLLSASGSSGMAEVLAGNGDGTFGAARSFRCGARASAVAAGDLDGDGWADLVVASRGDDNADFGLAAIGILYGSGNGSFGAPVTYRGLVEPKALAVSDFDLDGHQDVAVVDGAGLVFFRGTAAARQSSPTEASITSSPNPSEYRQTAVFTATVSSADGTPTGVVTFLDGSTPFGSAQLFGGTAILATPVLAPGERSLTAFYAGDGGFGTSTSPVLIHTVTKAQSTATVSATPNPVAPGAFVTLTAVVRSDSGFPTGNVTFNEGEAVLATRTLSSGQAFFTTSSLSAGLHLVTVRYGGDATFVPSTSAVLALVIGTCPVGPGTLCLSGARFGVRVAWTNPYPGGPYSGVGVAVPLTSDTGYFWFFDPTNIELVVKVLDGRPVNGHFWVSYGALSDVAYTVTVTDSETHQVKTYVNPARTLGSRFDTGAF